MSKRIWILIASFIPALLLTIALLLIMSPASEAAPLSTTSFVPDKAAHDGNSSIELDAAILASSTTTITADMPEPSELNQSVTVTFSVSGTGPDSLEPTGKVTVTISGGSESCADTLSAGAGQCQITPTLAGLRTITATYGGDSNFTGSSDTEPHTVNQTDTTTVILSDPPDPSVVGQPVDVAFSVTSNLAGIITPTGQVTVTISGGSESCVDTLSDGAGQCQITPTIAEPRTLTATYGGDTNFIGSNDTEPHMVNKAGTTTTIINDTPEPSEVGKPVLVTFSVLATAPGSGFPTGQVTVTLSGGSESCVGPLVSGEGQCQITPTLAGLRTLTATYDGDDNYNGSNGIELHEVTKADTTTTITADIPDPSALDQPITVTFSVTSTLAGLITPTGNVSVTISGHSEGCMGALSAGAGLCQLTPSITGTHTITATYVGDANFKGSSDTEPHLVKVAGTTTNILTDAPDPSVVGQPVTVTFSVTSTFTGIFTPTGQVTVTISGGPEFCVGALSAGASQCQLTPLIAGARTFTATYGGDAKFTGSSDSEPHTVKVAGTTTTIIDDTPDPSLGGQPVTVKFMVAATSPGSGTPTGQVTVTISGGSEFCVGALLAGAGQCQLTLINLGSRTLTATYAGDANYNGSSGQELHTVNKADVFLYMPLIFKS